MLAILKLVSEIFLRTSMAPTDKHRFLKPLASKAKVYIEEIAKYTDGYLGG
jgi:hypothetical protein